MKHEFKNNDGVDEFRVGLSTGKCELKCLKCGNWIRVAPDNMSWVEGCPGEQKEKPKMESSFAKDWSTADLKDFIRRWKAEQGDKEGPIYLAIKKELE